MVKAFVENLRFLFDDGAFTSTFEAGRGDRLALVRAEYTSNRKGAFSTEHCAVAETDAEGRLIRMVLFDIDHIDAAYAELEARDGASPSAWTPNLATTSGERFRLAMEAKDLDTAASTIAPDFRAISRRRLLQGEMNRDEYLAFMRLVVTMESAATTVEVLATRGDRLVLGRLSFRGENRSVGTSEVEYVDVLEVDSAGLLVVDITFDPDDLDSAYAELEARSSLSTNAQSTAA